MSPVMRALAVVGALIAIPLGCRGVLGIEEREFDSTLADGGDGALSCAAYCAEVAEACTGSHQQYASEEACLKLCKTFPAGTLADETGHTLGCRINAAKEVKATGEVEGCLAAGPGGSGVCGTNCQAYCTSVEALCPTQFATFAGKCLDRCGDVPDCKDYQADPLRNDDSIQCRLFHVSSAAVGPGTHCPHTIAVGKCGGDADGGLTDAGALCQQ